VHLVWRHAVGQVPFPSGGALNAAYDKWQLGPLRLLDTLALVVLAMRYGPMLVRRLPRPRVLEALGAASLPVFCAHLVLAMLALAVFGAATPDRPWAFDVALLAGSYLVLYGVACASAAIDRRARRIAQRVRETRDPPRARPSPLARPTAAPSPGGRRSVPATMRTPLD
jgi:peptidoglycan/LPS O-acetylase OafA/YrhL